MKEGYTLNVTSDNGTVIVREGAAPEINEPKQHTFSGQIDSPYLYANFWKEDMGEAIVEVDRNKKLIRLVVDPTNRLPTVIS